MFGCKPPLGWGFDGAAAKAQSRTTAARAAGKLVFGVGLPYVPYGSGHAERCGMAARPVS